MARRFFINDDLLSEDIMDRDEIYSSSDRHFEEVMKQTDNPINKLLEYDEPRLLSNHINLEELNQPTKETIIIGLIKEGYSLPVDAYILDDKLDDINDYDYVKNKIDKFINENVGYHKEDGIGYDEEGYEVNTICKGDKDLIVCVTGITMAIAALIQVCGKYGINLTLLNYDTSTGKYEEQPLF